MSFKIVTWNVNSIKVRLNHLREFIADHDPDVICLQELKCETDINQEMLEICQSRAIDRNILNNFDLVVADAEKLPFPDNSFDYYTIAFGIRNMVSIENALAEALRVLKPTGKFLCLEFSKVQNDIVKPLYDFYTFNVIPKIGNCVAGNQDAYRYLAESIRLFPDQEDFKTMIQKIGFTNVAYKNLTFGTAAIHYGFKGKIIF